MSATTLDNLERRLADLQDIEAIETLKARYWRAIDRRRPAEVEACFIQDATIDFEGLPRYESREGFMAMVRQAAGSSQTFNMHHGQNPRITITGPNTAAGEWDIFYFGIDLGSQTIVQMAGIYTDTYVRENGNWLIATTTMRQTSIHAQLTSPTLRSVTLGRTAG